MVSFKYLRMTATHQNFIHEEIKSRLWKVLYSRIWHCVVCKNLTDVSQECQYISSRQQCVTSQKIASLSFTVNAVRISDLTRADQIYGVLATINLRIFCLPIKNCKDKINKTKCICCFVWLKFHLSQNAEFKDVIMKYESVRHLYTFSGAKWLTVFAFYFGGSGLQQFLYVSTCISSSGMVALVDIVCQIWHQLWF